MQMASYHGEVQITEFFNQNTQQERQKLHDRGWEGNVISFSNINGLVVERELLANSEK
jgi:hypothetical protein